MTCPPGAHSRRSLRASAPSPAAGRASAPSPAADAQAADLATEYLLDPAVAFLNHGSFGAVPRPVFEERARIQRECERNPVHALAEVYDAALDAARTRLGVALGVSADELAWVENATTGLNLIARSLVGALSSRDEVLVTELEYGAQQLAWKWLCERHGVEYREARIAIPVAAPHAIAEELLGRLSERTRVVLMSHITSDTALRVPVELVCTELTRRGIVSVIDGAHAPGQIALAMGDAPWDYYVGNLHKWFAAPRGAAFIHASRDRQRQLDPLVVSWGASNHSDSLARRTQWSGTSDPSAWLTVPSALDFHERRLRPLAPGARALLAWVGAELAGLGLRPCALEPDPELLMASFLLPGRDVSERVEALLAADHVQALVKHESPYGPLLRVSVAWYVTRADAERLIAALAGALRA
jgi:isopenicillin-N epimerase